MKTEKKNLGKVSLTCNGKWDIHKSYERLCLVHDGMFASYISKQPVPVDIEIENDKYWQPVANLKGDIKLDLQNFKNEFLQLLAEIQRKLSGTRIVVQDVKERDELGALEVGVGCEVYVVETKQTWILDKIVVSDGDIPPVKEWHLEADGRIDSVERFELQGEYPAPLTADRALCDTYGNIIHDHYLTRDSVHEYVDGIIHDFIDNWKYEISDGTITWSMLSEALKEMFKATGTSIVNFPDEEDITVMKNTLKFKDRKYAEGEFNGKGYKILRKNWMNGTNLLEQAMLDQENTIYEIRYMFCLDGKSIAVPKNCILYFNGGSINNGTVDINEAYIHGLCKLSEFGDVVINGKFALGQVMYLDNDTLPMGLYVYFNEWQSLGGASLDMSQFVTKNEFDEFKNSVEQGGGGGGGSNGETAARVAHKLNFSNGSAITVQYDGSEEKTVKAETIKAVASDKVVKIEISPTSEEAKSHGEDGILYLVFD